MKVQIDSKSCQGHGRCYDLAPGLARFPELTLADPAAVTWAAGQVRGPRTLPLRVTGD